LAAKGMLLERAGIEGDTTQHNNFLDNRLKEVNKRIDRMEDIFRRREDHYYRQFAAMEKALKELYSQGDWLMMNLNTGWL
jgi:flagellar hook-associated protein 2